MRNTKVYLVTDDAPIPEGSKISKLDNRTGYKVVPIMASVMEMGVQQQHLLFNGVYNDSKVVIALGRRTARWIIFDSEYKPTFDAAGFTLNLKKEYLNEVTLRRNHRNRTAFYIMGTKAGK
ncbi:hypothetical protein QYM39_06020 [Pediococcus pentosaceus]|uniref:hypothetical protein n=1 Tax=Pediococcus pentosaceus TaxID=1255 RepID=UPI0026591581|nr:hypothetical protein [Pediococcus pentosaceus]WKF70464.1 hypothetical protein QYM39_06020 [Pediococcus pentosaceus]